MVLGLACQRFRIGLREFQRLGPGMMGEFGEHLGQRLASILAGGDGGQLHAGMRQ